MGVLMFKRLLCFMGFHKWLYIRSEYIDTMRSNIRKKLHGQYMDMGQTSYISESIEDRVCAHCRKEDFNIRKTAERILKEEVIIFEYTKKYE